MADRHWVLGTGNWSDTGHWSASSGGASGASVPTSSDNAIFDSNSGGGTATVNAGATRECLGLTMTGFTGAFTVTEDLNVYDNVVLGATMGAITGINSINMKATSGAHTFTSNGKTMTCNVDIGPSTGTSTFTLVDNLSCDLLQILALEGVIVDANDKNVTCSRLRQAATGGASPGILLMGNGTWTLTGTGDLIDQFDSSLTVTKEGSSIVVSDTSSTAKDYELGGHSWPEITLPVSTAVHTFYDGGNLDSLTAPAGTQIKFESLKTFGLGDLVTTGNAGSHVSISSTTGGSQHILNTTAGENIEVDYLTIQDSDARGNFWFAGDHSTDSGNNDGWIFNSLESYLWSSEKRNVAQSLLVSWKKHSTLGSRTFTIGVSLIGGNDAIGINPGAIGSPGNYQYFDESDNVLSLAWEHGLHMPTGGLSQGLAEGILENTDGRFLPHYMGGNSELFTSILPRRPFIINAGFEFEGTDRTIPQFTGIFTRQPEVDRRSSRLRWMGSDYTDFFYNRFLDQSIMFTSQRTDTVMENLLQDDLGLSTAQYELDTGINIIPFGLFERGTRYSHIFNQLAEAENGHFYQDEEGIFRFENRQHWDSGVHTSVSTILYTAQVLEAEAPDEDHIINVVEIRAKSRGKQPEQTIFKLNTFDSIELPTGNTEKFVDFEDPVLSVTTPTSSGLTSFFKVNTLADGTGTDVSSSVTISNITTFAKSTKITFNNSSSNQVFITELVITGRPAKIEKDIYVRDQDDSSVTAFEERLLSLENDYIQNADWAQSYAGMILQDYAEPENLQKITIRAIPQVKLGDLVSWQGRHWRVFNKKLSLMASEGFVQELTLLQRQITTYFRIGISTIGGSDKIAP